MLLKKPMFLLPFARQLTHSEGDAYDDIPFRYAESFGDETVPALTAPTPWGDAAAEVVAEAACQAIPSHLRAIEENTVPSWLWHHRGKGASVEREGDLRQIFNRVVGAATASAWKAGLFSTEKHARSFYDEARCALILRHIAFEPSVLKNWGTLWAYGTKATPDVPLPNKIKSVSIRNAQLDAERANKRAAAPSTTSTARNAAWKKAFAVSPKQVSCVNLHLSDTAADWHDQVQITARAAIDILALRHNDGSVNIDALRHRVRLATLMIDLHHAHDVTLGIANLSALLMALGLAYDSEAGRALAAAVTAIVTAECLTASAELAALRGPSENFTNNREAIMRRLRNHCRAAHGDRTDYEHIAIVPNALALKNCPDLALVAAAQQGWDNVVALAKKFGLRATHVTDLMPSPALAVMMQTASQGLQPMHSLMTVTADDEGVYHTTLHAAAEEALARLAYTPNTANVIAQHITGTHDLHKSTGVTLKRLRACGLSESSCAKIQTYLPQVNTLRLAVTPWVIGLDACRTELKIAPRLATAPRFDLLKHLGFSDDDVNAANAVCYGFGTVRNAKTLHLRHRPVFAHGHEINNDALIRMAASVQSFITGETGTAVTLPVQDSVNRGLAVVLSAWRQGLKSITLVFDPALAVPALRTARDSARVITAATQAHNNPMHAVSPATGRARYSKKAAPISAMRKSSERRSKTI